MGLQVKASCAAAVSCCNHCVVGLCFVLSTRHVAQSMTGAEHDLRWRARQAAQAQLIFYGSGGVPAWLHVSCGFPPCCLPDTPDCTCCLTISQA